MININLREIFPVDNQSDLSAKLNFNFNQLLALGFGERGETGPAGEIGPIGPIGPIGAPGDPGSQIFSYTEAPSPATPPDDPSEAVVNDYLISNTAIYQKVTTSSWNLISDFEQIFSNIAASSTSTWQLGVKNPSELSRMLLPIHHQAGIDRINGAGDTDSEFSTNDPNWVNGSSGYSNSQVTLFNFDPRTTKSYYESASDVNSYGVNVSTSRTGNDVDDTTFPYTALLSLYSFYDTTTAAIEPDQFSLINGSATGYRHQIELGSIDNALESLVSTDANANYVISPTWQNLRIRKYRNASTSQPGGLMINADFNLSSADTSLVPALNSRFTWKINKKTLANSQGTNITLSLSNSMIESDLANRLTGISVDGLHLLSGTYKLAIGIDPTNTGSKKNVVISGGTTLDTVIFDGMGLITTGTAGTSSFTPSGITGSRSITIQNSQSASTSKNILINAGKDIVINARGSSGTNGGSVFVIAPNPSENIYLGFSTSALIASDNWTTSSGYALKINRNRLAAGIPFPVSTSTVPAGNSVDDNVLDEYQEKDFTPTISYNPDGLTFPTAAPGVLQFNTPTIADQTGKFTKIGNTVNFVIRFSISGWQALVGRASGTSAGYTYGTSPKGSSEEDLVTLAYGNLSTSTSIPTRPTLGAEPWQVVIRDVPNHWPDRSVGGDFLKFNVQLTSDAPYTPPLRGNVFTYRYSGTGTGGAGALKNVRPWGSIDPASLHAKFGLYSSSGANYPQLELWGNRRNFDTVYAEYTGSGTGDDVVADGKDLSILQTGQASSIPSRVSIYDFLTPYAHTRKVYVTVSGSYITTHTTANFNYTSPPDPIPVDDTEVPSEL